MRTAIVFSGLIIADAIKAVEPKLEGGFLIILFFAWDVFEFYWDHKKND